MPATLRFGDSLRNIIDLKTPELQVEAGRKVLDILVSLHIKPELVAMVVVNEELQSKDYVIQEGDFIRAMAIIGGG